MQPQIHPESVMPTTPDLDKALAHYAHIAAGYDRSTARIARVRSRAVAALQLRAGQTALDIGCGTGACLAALSHAVGLHGTVIGIEPSFELLAQARARVARLGLANVQLIGASAESAALAPHATDAALFCYTHDVLQTQAALDNVFAALRTGAQVAACGTQLLPRWCFPLPHYQKFTHRHYIVAQSSMGQPCASLALRLDGFTSARVFPWHSYVASGQAARRVQTV
jgi:ubiquinone/menaquinone biosynthesis C-methylase UbiE